MAWRFIRNVKSSRMDFPRHFYQKFPSANISSKDSPIARRERKEIGKI